MTMREYILKEIDIIRERSRDLFYTSRHKKRTYDDLGITNDESWKIYPMDLDFNQMSDERLIDEYTYLIRRDWRQR